MNSTPQLLDRKSLLQSLLFIIIVILIAGLMSVYILSDKSIKEAFIFNNFARIILDHYSENLDSDKVIESARKAMFADLDRYSTYIKPIRFRQMDEELTGGYYGIGLSVISHDSGLMVMSVRENSPASEGGLFSGDIILKADSIDLAGLTTAQASNHLRGQENSSVRLKIFRSQNNSQFKVDIVRRRIELMHIPFAGLTPDRMIYIRLLDFDAGSSNDLKKALDSLLKLENLTPEGIILDLRNNPGGLFSEAYKVAALFLDEGLPVVGTNGRSIWNSEKFDAKGGDVTGGISMSIIVDRGSASSSEIVAGTLKYHQRAILVGDTTFGKGLVQGFVRYPEGDGIKLTISRYYFGDDIYLNEFDSTLNEIGEGIPPDYYFAEELDNSFIRTLERSLNLFHFANQNQDEIIENYQAGLFDDSWLEQLAMYLEEKDFKYESDRSQIISLIKEIAVFDNNSKRFMKECDKLLKYSIQIDQNELFHQKEYLKRRLAQIAFERKYGIYKSYSEVIIKHMPIVKYAAEILKDKS